MANLQTLANLVAKDLQKAIRMESSDDRGRCQCVTCGVVKSYKVMHAGHFVGGRTMGVLFDERNIHPQCAICNLYGGGEQDRYEWFMRMRYGQEVIDELRKRRREIVTITRDELAEMRARYKHRIKIQEVRLGG